MDREYYDKAVKDMEPMVVGLLKEWWDEHGEGYKGIPWPLVKIMHYNDAWFFRKADLRKDYHAYMSQSKQHPSHAAYAQLYKILAFHIYGFGNWSNSDRRRNGKNAIRRRR